MTRSSLHGFAGALLAAAIGIAGCTSDSSPSSDTIARECVFESACAGQAASATVGGCATLYRVALDTELLAAQNVPLREANRILNCGSSNSCTDFNDCITRHHGATYCAAHPGTSCDGSVLVDCSGTGTNPAVDCASYGLECHSGSSGGACTTAETCDPATEMVHCDGNRLIACNQDLNLRVALDCGTLAPGWQCATAADGSPRCVPATPTCTAGMNRCDGDVLVSCQNEVGHEFRIDCGQLYAGGHCSVTGTTAQCVMGNTAACSTDTDACNGTQIESCYGGSLHTIDCASLGFRTCQLNDQMQATCVN